MTYVSRTARLQRRIGDLATYDDQFAATRPRASVTAAVEAAGLRLPQIIQTVFEGYAERPALGYRVADFVKDPDTGRITRRLLPEFETITYKELSERVTAVAGALATTVRPGERVCTLGFPSPDYMAVDLALIQIGAVSVPLPASTPASQMLPIALEAEPSVIAVSLEYLPDAVELVVAGATPTRLLVFDYHHEADDQRETFSAAVQRLSKATGDIAIDTLSDVLDRGATAPTGTAFHPAQDDPLLLLIYTSGSTGAPKGAMYTERLIANAWRASARAAWGKPTVGPSIALSFMPMSSLMGRGMLYWTLASGGTAYFAGRSDSSTLLEDVALVRPTELLFVPRVWDMLFQVFRGEVDRRCAADLRDRLVIEAEVLSHVRKHVLGGRYIFAMTGSAPTSPEVKAWVEKSLDVPLVEGYGATETGIMCLNGEIRRPPVISYKLVDLPHLGYFRTDQPYPRGELLIRSEDLFTGYYKRPEVTASVFDADGYYRTGDVVSEVSPGRLVYVDRRNNVLKLAQGQFVTVAKLEAVFSNSPLVQQIYVYGNSSHAFLLAVVVPTEDAFAGYGADALKAALAESLQRAAQQAGLQSYEVPRDFLIETNPFSLENGLLTGAYKLAWTRLRAHYEQRLEQLYGELAERQDDELNELRRSGADAPVLATLRRAASALLGAAAGAPAPEAHFTDLGGDSLSALSYGSLLQDIFGVEVPVGVIVSPATDLAALADYIETQRAGSIRPTFAGVHGRDAVEVAAADLKLDKFLDAETLAVASTLPVSSGELRTVLLTGATGFLGRYLVLEWLERLAAIDGTDAQLICLVRAKNDAHARARLDAIFDGADDKLLARYTELAAKHLEVLAGDKSAANLGLEQEVWRRLSDTVDVIVDSAALVNHMLPYSELFAPNALGTAELIRLALTSKIKPFSYVSTIGVGDQVAPGTFTEDADARLMSPVRAINDSYANGYGTSKWAGEVLLREANDLCGLPVAVFRCGMILADTSYAGQLNLPDMFTRTMLSLVATGIAPSSFYELDSDRNRRRAHYDGLPVKFIAEAITTLGAKTGSLVQGFATYHVVNPHDDGLGVDEFVDWLIEAGYPIQRIADYGDWLQRFETTLRALPERQRQASLLPLLHNYQKPQPPITGSTAPTDRFRAAVRGTRIGAEKDIPHVSAAIIVKYITDLRLLGLL
ncbi:carboxylic acid reductase [Mycobacterium sp. SMC-15]|uniref:carboxylic acid reductase n=1 Tax=Mycobacterium sp. SMC-15 TaxID=3381627 RepID=UPI00387619BF